MLLAIDLGIQLDTAKSEGRKKTNDDVKDRDDAGE